MIPGGSPPTVVNAYVVGGRLRLLRRDERGELVESWAPATWSFYVRKADAPKIASLRRQRTVREEGDYVRVDLGSWNERDKICRGFRTPTGYRAGYLSEVGVEETFEADLSPPKRWLVDTGARIQKPIPGFLDLESDSRVPFPEKARARILCWGLTLRGADGGPEKVGDVLTEDTDAAEKELLRGLFRELAHVDQILAWNGDRFDFEVLEARLEYLHLGYDLRRWLLCDHMLLFEKLNITASESGDEKASMALERVATSLGVEGKLEARGVGSLSGVKVGGRRTWDFWKAGGENRQLLLEYCVEDSATMWRIEHGSEDGKTAGTGYVDTLAALAETCGVFPDSHGMRGVAFVEAFLMRLGHQRGVRAPTRYSHAGRDEDEEKFKGAFVFPTRRGLFREVHIIDFARLYPSIMQAWNMSPETWIGRAKEPDTGSGGGSGLGGGFGGVEERTLTFEESCALKLPGVAVCPVTRERFRTDGPRGLFAAALDVVVEQRKFWSKRAASLPLGSPERREAERRDSAYKIIANTFYGVSGSPFSRYFLRELSESVTQIGVWLIQNTCWAADPDRDFADDLRKIAGNDPSVRWHASKAVPAPGRREKPLTTVAGDTDSGFLLGCSEAEMTEFVAWSNGTLYPGLVTPTGADASLISVAFEKTFSLMLNVAKKTYAGRPSHKKGIRTSDDVNPVIKGLDFKRGDTARIARDFQEEIVKKMLLFGKPLPEVYPLVPADFVPIVERYQARITGGEFEYEDAVLAQKIKKGLDEYGKTATGAAITPPAHVRVAQILAARGEPVYPGIKVEYVVVDGKASPQKVKPAADATKEDLDLYHLWEVETWRAAERVLSAVFPDGGWARWGAVRPKGGPRGPLKGQGGFGFGERPADLSLVKRY